MFVYFRQELHQLPHQWLLLILLKKQLKIPMLKWLIQNWAKKCFQKKTRLLWLDNWVILNQIFFFSFLLLVLYFVYISTYLELKDSIFDDLLNKKKLELLMDPEVMSIFANHQKMVRGNQAKWNICDIVLRETICFIFENV